MSKQRRHTDEFKREVLAMAASVELVSPKLTTIREPIEQKG
ncbi:hypothetical protein ACFLYO_06730 [Chloroflexota bacterium]